MEVEPSVQEATEMLLQNMTSMSIDMLINDKDSKIQHNMDFFPVPLRPQALRPQPAPGGRTQHPSRLLLEPTKKNYKNDKISYKFFKLSIALGVGARRAKRAVGVQKALKNKFDVLTNNDPEKQYEEVLRGLVTDAVQSNVIKTDDREDVLSQDDLVDFAKKSKRAVLQKLYDILNDGGPQKLDDLDGLELFNTDVDFTTIVLKKLSCGDQSPKTSSVEGTLRSFQACVIKVKPDEPKWWHAAMLQAFPEAVHRMQFGKTRVGSKTTTEVTFWGYKLQYEEQEKK